MPRNGSSAVETELSSGQKFVQSVYGNVNTDVAAMYPDKKGGHAQSAYEEDLDAAIGRALKVLPRPERDVIELIFGLAGDDPMNREQVATALHISAGLVEQRKNQAILRLKAPSNRVHLTKFSSVA